MFATDFRIEAAHKIWPTVKCSRLHPDAKQLLFLFFGLVDDEAPFLPDDAELRRAVCLHRPHTHPSFCRKLVWAFVDPESRTWVCPNFYALN